MKQMKAAGTKRELQVVHLMQERGYVAFRTPASLGVCDVIAMEAHCSYCRDKSTAPQAFVKFIEVKANTGSPFKSFSPLDRAALIAAAKIAGAIPMLIHWPPNKPMREIPADEWPESSLARELAA